jgi:ABC-type multidrug transport system fused ATPase/permease subunit
MASLSVNYFISLYSWRQKKEYSLRSTNFVLDKYMSLGMGFFIHHKSSALRAKLEAIPRQSDHLINTTQSFFQLIFELTMVLVILFTISPHLALLSCVFFSITGGVFNFIKKTINRIATEEVNSSINYDAKIQDILSRQILIFSTHSQEKEKDEFVEAYNLMQEKKYKIERINGLLNPFFLIFQIICVIII